jgi:redox-sensitive bicupin YhaK (pirin superfamily)
MILRNDINNGSEKQQRQPRYVYDKSRSDSRSVTRVVDSIQTLEGEGFLVHRAFPSDNIEDLDPFLLLDEFGPMNLAPGEAKGAPDHPHRGFETVTYMLAGQFEHKDSQGSRGKLVSGDVQWMTAGAGVIHSEMPEKEFADKGGELHGLQLWVNLPKRHKMVKPRYQDIPASRIPIATTPDGKVQVKVIAGMALETNAVIETKTPIIYLHFTLKPGSKIIQAVPSNYNTFAYVLNGRGIFGKVGQVAERGQMILFENDSDQVLIKEGDVGGKSNLDVLLIAGVPLKEPVARYGPFVMNTQSEVNQAIEDYRSGRMGLVNF